MLADPLVLLTTPNVSLKKINQDKYSTEYMFRDATSLYRAFVRHSKTKATATRPLVYDRHNFEVVQTVFAAGAVAEYERKFYFVMEMLPSDISTVLADGVADLAIASANAFLVQLSNWES